MPQKRNTTKFELLGADELTKLLQAYPGEIQKDIVNAAVARGATIIKNKTKDNIKGRGLVKTWKLEESIKIKKKPGRAGSYYIYADGKIAPHAHLPEFGTAPRKLKKPHVIKLGDRFVTVSYTGSVPATPFMRPALTENQMEVLMAMRDQMKKRMEKETKKMNQRYGTLSKSYRKKLAK